MPTTAGQKAWVAYYRVSTDKQGRSGLGLEAQQHAVRSYLASCNGLLRDELTEVESGRSTDRPMLAEALRLCRVHRATLIIAKLDRLARNVAFVSNLMESNVDFVAVDFPSANRLTIHILAAVAEHEAMMIRERTCAALAAAKARGVKLGGDRGNIARVQRQGVAASAEARRRAADVRARDVGPLALSLRDHGLSLRAVAQALEDQRIATARGGRWTATAVSRLLRRMEGTAA